MKKYAIWFETVAIGFILLCVICVQCFAGTVTTTYDPDEFEIVRKSKGNQFVPYNRITQFQSYSTQSYQGMRKYFQLDNR